MTHPNAHLTAVIRAHGIVSNYTCVYMYVCPPSPYLMYCVAEHLKLNIDMSLASSL